MPPEALTDEEIVVRVRSGAVAEYAEIVRRYETKLGHYARKFIRDQDELNDVLQEVFIKAYRNLHGFDVSKKFSSWIYRITHNEALNSLKKYKLESISLDEHEWDIVDDDVNIAKQTDITLAKEKLEKALGTMKEKYREPLMLYYFEQKTYEEISEILQVPKATVGVLILRAKEQLQKLYSAN